MPTPLFATGERKDHRVDRMPDPVRTHAFRGADLLPMLGLP